MELLFYPLIGSRVSLFRIIQVFKITEIHVSYSLTCISFYKRVHFSQQMNDGIAKIPTSSSHQRNLCDCNKPILLIVYPYFQWCSLKSNYDEFSVNALMQCRNIHRQPISQPTSTYSLTCDPFVHHKCLMARQKLLTLVLSVCYKVNFGRKLLAIYAAIIALK